VGGGGRGVGKVGGEKETKDGSVGKLGMGTERRWGGLRVRESKRRRGEGVGSVGGEMKGRERGKGGGKKRGG